MKPAAPVTTAVTAADATVPPDERESRPNFSMKVRLHTDADADHPTVAARVLRLGRAAVRPRWTVAMAAGAVALVVAVVGVGVSVDGHALVIAAERAGRDPGGMAVAVLAFAAAFGLRADAW